MRILYITNGFPYPLTSGYLRHYHLIRGLSAEHEIDLVSVVGRDFLPEHVEGMRPFIRSVEVVRSAASRRSLWRKAWRRGRDLVLAGGADGAGRELANRVRRLLAERRFDVALLSGKRTDPVLEVIGSLPLVVDLCDATSMRLRGQLEHADPLRRLALHVELRRVRGLESRLVRAGRHVLFASRRDRDVVLGEAADAPATVLPNGVDLDYWRRSQATLGDEVVFSGALHYPPNEDAALVLLREVMPTVWRSLPDVRLRLIGRDPTRRLTGAAQDARVTVTGFVDDVRPHLEAGAVFVAPIRFAAGIQNKLLEALAMELPVVTSPIAAAGLSTETDEPPVLVARTPGELAAATIAALRRVRSDREPDAAGRAFVASRFTWERAIETLDRVLVDAGGDGAR